MLTTIATFLFGGLKWLREALTAAFRWALAHPWQTALVIAIAAFWWQHGALNGVRKDLLAMTKARDAERAAHVQTVANYREASERAMKAAQEAKDRKEKEYARLAAQADQSYADLRSRYRSVLAASRTHPSGSNATGLPVSPGAARLPEAASGDAGLLISHSDGLKTADLAAYAEGCFRWVESVAATVE